LSTSPAKGERMSSVNEDIEEAEDQGASVNEEIIPVKDETI